MAAPFVGLLRALAIRVVVVVVVIVALAATMLELLTAAYIQCKHNYTKACTNKHKETQKERE